MCTRSSPTRSLACWKLASCLGESGGHRLDCRAIWSPKNLPRYQLFSLNREQVYLAIWLTFKQANELGGSVRGGAQSTLIVFWKIDQKEESVQEPGDQETHRRFLLRYYRAFNIEQCDLPVGIIEKLPKVETHEHEPIDKAELIVANMPQRPAIETAGAKVFYNLLTDRVTMPARELFTTDEEYYATLLHELIHSTGIPRALHANDHRGRAVRFCDLFKRRTLRGNGVGFSLR
jgi:antirestriction protein ArdC